MTRWRRGLALAALLAAPSCDLAIGLDGYAFADPMGGAGGEGGVGGAAPDCTMDEECTAVSGDCFVPTCDQGVCGEIPETSGTACDELGGDTCDATGGCRKSDGKGCEAAIECISNACVDGVCSARSTTASATTANVEQQGTHVAVVPGSDDVVAAGYFKGGLGTLVASTGRFNVFAMRFSSDGQLQWEKHWGSAAEDQRTDGLDVDAAGNVYLTGQLAGSIDFGTGALVSTTPTLDAFVAKLDPAGEGLWSVKLESPEDVHATDVAVAPDGRVVVVGHFEDTLTVAGTSIASGAPDERDVFLLTLAADGSLTALKRYGDAGGSQLAEAVAVDPHGNIALTGRFSSQLVIDGTLLQATSLTTRDIFAVLLAPDLTPLWGKAFGGPSLNDGGLGVAFSPSSDVAIAGGLRSTADFGGMSLTSQGEADLFVACFAP